MSGAAPAGGPGSVPAEIFKAYDVRGLYGEQMDGETAHLLGRAFARVLAELRGKESGELRVGVGRDMRLQAPEMAGRLAAGLADEGATVLDVGMVGTEQLYFLVGARELDGGAMITASHNPKAYTGVKLVREGALALSGETGIQRVREVIEAGMGTGRSTTRSAPRTICSPVCGSEPRAAWGPSGGRRRTRSPAKRSRARGRSWLPRSHRWSWPAATRRVHACSSPSVVTSCSPPTCPPPSRPN